MIIYVCKLFRYAIIVESDHVGGVWYIRDEESQLKMNKSEVNASDSSERHELPVV